MAGLVGQQFGNYRLLRFLGKGSFGEIYLGQHMYLKTKAAIKVLHVRIGADELLGFLREAQLIANLNHRHIVRVLEFDVKDGVPFLVMEYAPNGTLRNRHREGTSLQYSQYDFRYAVALPGKSRDLGHFF